MCQVNLTVYYRLKRWLNVYGRNKCFLKFSDTETKKTDCYISEELIDLIEVDIDQIIVTDIFAYG